MTSALSTHSERAAGALAKQFLDSVIVARADHRRFRASNTPHVRRYRRRRVVPLAPPQAPFSRDGHACRFRPGDRDGRFEGIAQPRPPSLVSPPVSGSLTRCGEALERYGDLRTQFSTVAIQRPVKTNFGCRYGARILVALVSARFWGSAWASEWLIGG